MYEWIIRQSLVGSIQLNDELRILVYDDHKVPQLMCKGEAVSDWIAVVPGLKRNLSIKTRVCFFASLLLNRDRRVALVPCSVSSLGSGW